MAEKTKSEDPWSIGAEDGSRQNEVRSRIKYEVVCLICAARAHLDSAG